jgi:hypothetical protein
MDPDEYKLLTGQALSVKEISLSETSRYTITRLSVVGSE